MTVNWLYSYGTFTQLLLMKSFVERYYKQRGCLPFALRSALKCAAVVTLLILTACSSSHTGGGADDPDTSPSTGSQKFPIPKLDLWESNMRNFGRKLCDPQQIAKLSTWEGNVWYYDGTRVYYQIAEYTGDDSWRECAGYVRDLYRTHVLSLNGKVGAWRVFPHGLALDYRFTGENDSKRAALLLATNSPFAGSGGGENFELSRETAYLIHAYLTAEELGAPPNPNLPVAVNYALGHLDQWTGSGSASYVKPFMVGLTAEALIRYHEKTGDERVLNALKQAANWLWVNAWDPSLRAFPYIICHFAAANQECREDHSKEGPDLNLLIAPLYAWLYMMTDEEKYREQADNLFEGGVTQAYLENGKQFSQNYRWSFDYVRWRSQ